MRLWHYRLLPVLPRAQLLGQHRECCALRGNGWGKKHATVDYVFRHSPACLVDYHRAVLREMTRRGYKHNAAWDDALYRGAHCAPWPDGTDFAGGIYPEHDQAYLAACLENLKAKGIDMAQRLAEDFVK